MTVWLVSMAHSFVAATLVGGLLLGLPTQPPGRRLVSAGVWLALAGLALGAAAYLFAVAHHSEVATRTTLRSAVLVIATAALVVLALRPWLAKKRLAPLLSVGAVLMASGLAAQAMFDFLAESADHSLSATAVLNTELILNIFAIAAGTAALIAVVPLVAHAARGARSAATVLLAVVLGLQGVLWTAEVMLGLLQLGSLDVTSGRVSFIAIVTEAKPYATYLWLALIAGLAVLRFVVGRQQHPPVPTAPVERRRRLALILSEQRWFRGALTTAGFLLVVMLYHDLYASQPPRLSAAVPVAADAEGEVRIPVEQVKDGRLHRFAYIASDGHRIRFFLINRYDADHVSIGVVFDACMICGNQGYIQEGNEVICVACNVRLFTPSIGKPGGCNPIPLVHRASADTITIAAADLAKGAKYFSEIVELAVTDPVTGTRLVNLKAPYQYDYGGGTFFFESRDSYEKFRADPERYVPAKGV
ncbi:MAG: DUF2318 domain-containing protein [Azospirillum sp.]|nr:DUF2318 domain-containing protein [Azospirillum sp.]